MRGLFIYFFIEFLVQSILEGFFLIRFFREFSSFHLVQILF